MRFYEISISDPNTGKSIVLDQKGGFTTGNGPTFTTIVKSPFNGSLTSDPGALQVQFDVPIAALATPQGAVTIKVSGVGLKMISQAANLAGKNITLKAGMAPRSLPLARPELAGLIFQGKILSSYGNWIGVAQTLDLVCVAGLTENALTNPAIPFFWAAGTSLQDVLAYVFSQAFPAYKSQISIDSNLVLAHDEAGYYDNINQFSDFLKGLTTMIGSQVVTGYQGVDIFFSGDRIYAYDGSDTANSQTVTLQFNDLIGQPTWLSATTCNLSVVMRADLDLTSKIRFPKAIIPPYAATSPVAGAQALAGTPIASQSAFQGVWALTEIHHFGNYREPGADAWVTTLTAVAPPPPAKPFGLVPLP